MVNWDPITGDAAGGEEITMYEVWWDAGTSGASWATLKIEIAPSFTYTHTQVPSIEAGVDYQLKYVAYNLHGSGQYSPIGIITASAAPD